MEVGRGRQWEDAELILRVPLLKKTAPLCRNLSGTSCGAFPGERLGDSNGRRGATLVAKGVPSIEIEGMCCVWDVGSNKMWHANWEWHRSFGI